MTLPADRRSELGGLAGSTLRRDGMTWEPTPRQRRRRVSNYALLLPSVWLLLVWLLPVMADSGVNTALFWFGVVVTLLGLPTLAAFLIRLLIPESHRWRRNEAVAAVVVVILVMLVSYGLGTQHPHMLNCNDFSISGNYAPDNCTPGTAEPSD